MTDERHKNGTSLTDSHKILNQMPTVGSYSPGSWCRSSNRFRLTNLLMILIAALVIAYIFSSVISVFERLGIKRSVAVILLFVLAGVFVIAADLLFIPGLKQEIMNVYAKFPEFSRQIQDVLLVIAQNSAGKYPFIESGIMNLIDNVFGPSGFLERTRNASKILMQATPFIMALILVPFFVFFLLKDWPGVMKRVMDWVPPSYVETTISVIGEINILVGKYLRGLAVDCFVYRGTGFSGALAHRNQLSYHARHFEWCGKYYTVFWPHYRMHGILTRRADAVP